MDGNKIHGKYFFVQGARTARLSGDYFGTANGKKDSERRMVYSDEARRSPASRSAADSWASGEAGSADGAQAAMGEGIAVNMGPIYGVARHLSSKPCAVAGFFSKKHVVFRLQGYTYWRQAAWFGHSVASFSCLVQLPGSDPLDATFHFASAFWPTFQINHDT